MTEGKILYDEREWRIIRFLDLTEVLADPALFDVATTQGYVPQRFNLLFSDPDVVAVPAGDAAAKEQLCEHIASGKALLPASSVCKVFTAADFAE